jgi:D-alanyl-D-alanine carboxypeptidase
MPGISSVYRKKRTPSQRAFAWTVGMNVTVSHRRRRRPWVAAVIAASLVTAATWAVLSSWPDGGSAASGVQSPQVVQAAPAAPAGPAFAGAGEGRVPDDDNAAIDEADGLLPADATAFDDALAGVSRLDPALRAALQAATRDASHADVEILLTSGWRSAAYQDALLADAVADYGSAAEAARWVATAATSLHVRGAAADVGGAGADEWLADHGARYGLCRIYDNEPWHVELRPDAEHAGCPETYADPTHDPRLAP